MEKIWLKSYPDDVPAELSDVPFRSVRDLFEQAFEQLANDNLVNLLIVDDLGTVPRSELIRVLAQAVWR